MLKKVITGALMSLVGIMVPALGNMSALAAPHLWVMVATGIVAHVCQPAYKPFDPGTSAEDRGTALQILWSCALVQVAAVVEAVYLRYPTSFDWDWVALVGLVSMILGLALRTWAVWKLGEFFT